MFGKPIRRRTAVRSVATAAVATGVGGAILSACAGATKSGGSGSAAGSTLPTPASGVIKLVFQANTQGIVSFNKTTAAVFQQFVDQNFNLNPQYKGLWATPIGWGGGSTQVTDDIAGKGAADVWEMCCGDVPTLIHSGFAQSLNELLRQDNIPTSHWSSGHLEANSLAGTIYGLPSYDGTMTTIYRQDVLDTLGLPYPDPTWTGAQAAELWQKVTGTNKNGSHRYGVDIYWGQEDLDWWLYGWGASEMNAAQDQATMYTSEGVAAMTYLQNLITSHVANPGVRGVKNLISGAAVFQQAHSAYVINSAVELGSNYKWDFLPNPVWDKTSSCMMTIDCNMLNAASKHPKEAWELFKWLNLGAPQGNSYDFAWPKFQIDVNLITPGVVDLWPYWQSHLTSTVPTLKNKALQYWVYPSTKGTGRPQLFYRYDWSAANSAENNWLGQIRSGKMAPALALKQMQDQVNAIEVAAKARSAKTATVLKEFPTVGGKNIASVPYGI